jgi:hypothetical protein
MICPECGLEYENGVLDCESCQAPLMDEDGGEEGEDAEFAALVESTDVTYFGLMTARLEEAGIPWFVQGETSLGVLPRDGGEAGVPGHEVVTVYVAETRFDEARQLVRDFDPVGVVADD